MIKASKLAKEKNQRFIIVALAPLTTVAVAAALDHTLKDRVHQLFIMGGAVSGQGFTNFSTEFNFDRDPEAAHKTLESYDNIVILPIETAPTATHNLEETIEARSVLTPLGKFWRAISRVLCKDKADDKEYGCAIFDAVCMACALDESVIQKSILVHATVDVNGQYTRGGLILEKVDFNEHHDEFYGIKKDVDNKRVAKIILECDRKKVISLINGGVLKYEEDLKEAI